MSVSVQATAEAGRPTRIALAGNPNTGKTTLFNALTGSRAKIANYPGVTVEQRRGTLKLPNGEQIQVVDLPGCYSLTARAMDEEVAHRALIGLDGGEPADVVVLVADASNLHRNLYLALQLLECGRPLVLALNMMDVAKEKGISINIEALERELGIPVVPLVAKSLDGIAELKTLLGSISGSASDRNTCPTLPERDLEHIEDVRLLLKKHGYDASTGNALWHLCSNAEHLAELPPPLATMIGNARTALDAPMSADSKPAAPGLSFARRVIVARYAVVDTIISKSVEVSPSTGPDRTERIDRVVTHPVWGMLIFIGTMGLLFFMVFAGAEPLMGHVEAGMGALSEWFNQSLPDGVLKEFIVFGLIAGVGNILVFLPQIVLLFLILALLEDSGYMARAALLVDSLMRRVGLHGKAFVPLLSSFACAVPGVMAARTISGRRDRLVTIMVAPLMSCSARLPVYTLVTAAVFGSTMDAALIITAMYFLGIFAALGVAFLLKRTILKSKPAALILELPAYKRPATRTVFLTVYRKARLFVVHTGSVILALSVILWAMMSFPKTEFSDKERVQQEAVLIAQGKTHAQVATELRDAQNQANLKNSIAGRIGRFIEPVIKPLGFDWKIGIGLVGSFAAREVLVSTLGQVYGVASSVETDEEPEINPSLQKKLRAEVDPVTGKRRFTPLVGVSLLVFFVLAMQCLSTVAVVRRETGTWRWPLFMIVYMNGLAWLASFAVFQVGGLLGYS